MHQAHMMSHITCHLRFLCWVHVTFGQLSSLPSSLFSPSSSCLVQVACDVIQPAVLFSLWSVLSIIQLPCTRYMLYHPASWFVPLYSVQHCAPSNVKLSQSTMLLTGCFLLDKKGNSFLNGDLHLNVHFIIKEIG